MVLVWAPPGSSADPCAGLKAWLASRPPEQHWFVVLNYVLFYGFIALGLGTLVVYYRFRHEPRLEPRSFQVTCASFLVTAICFVIVCFRKTVVDADGHTLMPCRVQGWLYVSMAPLQTGVSLVRLINLLNRARYAKYARRMRRVVAHHGGDDAQTVVTGTGTSEDDDDFDVDAGGWVKGCALRTVRRVRLVASDIVHSFRVVKSSFLEAHEFVPDDDDEDDEDDDDGGDENDDHADDGRNEGGDEESKIREAESISSKKSHKSMRKASTSGPHRESRRRLRRARRLEARRERANYEALRLTKDALSTRSSLVVIGLVYAVVTVFIAILFATADVYRRGECTGCDLFLEVVIIMIVTFFTLLGFRVRIAYLLKDAPDPDGIVAELKYSTIVFLPLLLTFLIVMGIDPGLLDFRYVVSWEWIFLLGMTIVFFISCPLQVYLALRERRDRERHKLTTKKDQSIVEALKNPHVLERFETFAETHFCVESIHFLTDAWEWIDKFAGKAENWRRIKAKALLDTYVAQGGILEINIPSGMRQKMLAEFQNSASVAATLFDAAVEEIVRVLKWNLWVKFINSGGLDGGDKFARISKETTPRHALATGSASSTPRSRSRREGASNGSARATSPTNFATGAAGGGSARSVGEGQPHSDPSSPSGSARTSPKSGAAAPGSSARAGKIVTFTFEDADVEARATT